MKKAKIIAFNLLLALVLLEFISFLFISFSQTVERPRAWVSTVDNSQPKNVDSDSLFGVWHLPNSSFHHVMDCFDVYNYINSYGARDKERARNSDESRVMFLGDSFVEGFGVDTSHRFSNILENKLGTEMLNFGTSGNFGVTQMRCLYQKYGTSFEHDIVAIGLMPSNDFIEDDLEFGKSYFSNRYRPYLVKENDHFKTIYHLEALEESDWYLSNIIKNPDFDFGVPDNQGAFKKFLSGYSHFYQVLKVVKNRVVHKQEDYASVFHTCSDLELERLFYNLSFIDSLAQRNNANVLVFSIPVKDDFTYFYGTQKSNVLSNRLEEFCKSKEMTYVDLFENDIPFEDINELFLPCDGHWSAKGNKVAADVLEPHIKKVLEERELKLLED